MTTTAVQAERVEGVRALADDATQDRMQGVVDRDPAHIAPVHPRIPSPLDGADASSRSRRRPAGFTGCSPTVRAALRYEDPRASLTVHLHVHLHDK